MIFRSNVNYSLVSKEYLIIQMGCITFKAIKLVTQKGIDMSTNSTLRKNIIVGLKLLLSFMFLLSAVSKLYPSPYFALTTFEIKQLLPMGFSQESAAYFSRILIGCELALGILLLLPFYYRRLVLPTSFLLLFVFSVHLTYGLITVGNDGNCGCFGALLPMTPLQALIKNIIAMGVIAYLYKFTPKSADKLNFSLLTSVTFASILAVFMVGPMRHIPTVVEDPLEDVYVDEPTDDDVVIDTTEVNIGDTTSTANPLPVVKQDEPKKKKSGFKNYFPDIDKGRKILCFFAPGCDHCKETAKELTQLKKQIPDFPEVRIVFMDEEPELIPAFFEFAGAKYPYQIADVAAFWTSLGGTKDTPGVFYLWNGNIIKEYDGINEKKFKMSEFKTIVTKPWSELKK